MLHADDGEVGALGVRQHVFRRLDVEQADTEPAEASGQASASRNGRRHAVLQADAPAEEEQRGLVRGAASAFTTAACPDARKLEEPLAFEEEVATLGEELAEAGEVHLLLVFLHLGEVGVVGEVERQASRDAVLGVDAEVALEVVRIGRGGHLVRQQLGDGVGLQLEVARRGRHLDADERRRDVEPRGARSAIRRRHRRQVGRLVLPAHDAADVHAPHLVATLAVAQRLEGNNHFAGPALIEVRAAGVPHRVPIEVVTAALVSHQRVADAAERVRLEVVAAAPVVEGVERHAEAVVLADAPVVATQFVRLQSFGVAVPHAAGEIQVLVVVEHPEVGVLGRLLAFVRLLLDEAVRRVGAPVDVLVEPAVERQRLVDPHRAHRDAPLLVAHRHGWRHRRGRTVDAGGSRRRRGNLGKSNRRNEQKPCEAERGKEAPPCRS